MIALENVSIRAGNFALDGVGFVVPAGQYGILMGKTGSGKTTILEAVCGLRKVLAGKIILMDREVTHVKAAERGIGYVPQDVALFPSLTVREHFAFALQIRNWTPKAIAARIDEMAELLDVRPLLDRRPLGLSGGEAQRVALGRSLSFHPKILCLDEPLSALDHDMRLDMCALLKRVKDQLGVTVLHITHDRNEAARLADTLFHIEDGGVIAPNSVEFHNA